MGEAPPAETEAANSVSRNEQRNRARQEAMENVEADVRRANTASRDADRQLLMNNIETERNGLQLEERRVRMEEVQMERDDEKTLLNLYANILADNDATQDQKQRAREGRMELMEEMQRRKRRRVERDGLTVQASI